MYTPHLVAMHNSVGQDGRLRGHRFSLPLVLTGLLEAIVAPISHLWNNFMVTSAEHSWVNPMNGAGFGSDSEAPTPRPVLSSVYRRPPLAQDLSPGLLLRGLTTQQNTVRSVAYPFYPSAGTLTPIAYNQHIQTWSAPFINPAQL